jgi:catechol 2,3-dioxygenase-like lactoylglutathione lyase family enzyme
MFKRIDHVEIVTDQLDRTVQIYTEVWGFTLIVKAGITSFANRSRSSNWTSSGVPSGVAHTTRSTPGIALFDRLQQLEDVGWRAGEETAGLHRILDARQLGGGGELGVAHRRDLIVG